MSGNRKYLSGAVKRKLKEETQVKLRNETKKSKTIDTFLIKAVSPSSQNSKLEINPSSSMDPSSSASIASIKEGLMKKNIISEETNSKLPFGERLFCPRL